MKIVHVEDVFHPDTGYQLNLLSRYMAAAGHDVVIITAETERLPKGFMNFFGSENISERDEIFEHKYGVRIIRTPIKGYYSGRVILSSRFFNIIKDENPDVVYVHGNDTLTGMRCLLNLKKMKYPIVMDSHMLDMAAKNKLKSVFRFFYKKIFASIIIKNRIPVIRTQDSDYIEKVLGIPLLLAPWISTGSDTMLFKKDQITRNKMRQKNNIKENEFVVTYAGKLDEAKGGMLLARVLREKIDLTSKEICFVIIGNAVGEYGQQVEDMFSASENRILRFGTQKYTELAPFFQMSDLIIFPKQCSLSFYDAQACGIPVLFEDNEINSKRVINGNAVTFKSDDIYNCREKIIQIANMNTSDYLLMSRASERLIKESYDYKRICDTYLDVITKEIDRYNKAHKCN